MVRRFGWAGGFAAFVVLVCVVLASGCAKKPMVSKPNYYAKLPEGVMALEKVTDPKEYPDFSMGFPSSDEAPQLLKAVDYSLKYLTEHPSSRKFFPYLGITHTRCVQSLQDFRTLLTTCSNGDDFRARIVDRYEVYRSVGCNTEHVVLFTGYCEPILNGSLTKDDVFKYPLYKLPPDLVKDPETGACLGRQTETGGRVPYYKRSEIDGEHKLEGKNLELVWLSDPFDAYIAHVQGSARIKLPDGSETRIGYAGKNEWPYGSIGLWLVEQKKLEEKSLSLDGLRLFFKAKPEELQPTLFHNESYVFFTKTDGGPYGCLNQPVTGYRSIATDKAIFPRACIAFADTKVPTIGVGNEIQQLPFKSFLLDQDTGGAIRAPGRADIFMGSGEDATTLAGRTYAEGTLFYIFLKPSLVNEEMQSPAKVSK